MFAILISGHFGVADKILATEEIFAIFGTYEAPQSLCCFVFDEFAILLVCLRQFNHGSYVELEGDYNRSRQEKIKGEESASPKHTLFHR